MGCHSQGRSCGDTCRSIVRDGDRDPPDAGMANVKSLVERVSRFAIFLPNNDRQSRPVMDGLIQALRFLPHFSRRPINFDRGTEFTDWPYLQASIGIQTWFCDPQSSWQKGTVENTNGRVRK
jgi:IS30 family transposase